MEHSKRRRRAIAKVAIPSDLQDALSVHLQELDELSPTLRDYVISQALIHAFKKGTKPFLKMLSPQLQQLMDSGMEYEQALIALQFIEQAKTTTLASQEAVATTEPPIVPLKDEPISPETSIVPIETKEQPVTPSTPIVEPDSTSTGDSTVVEETPADETPPPGNQESGSGQSSTQQDPPKRSGFGR